MLSGKTELPELMLLRFLLSYGITRPQRLNVTFYVFSAGMCVKQSSSKKPQQNMAWCEPRTHFCDCSLFHSCLYKHRLYYMIQLSECTDHEYFLDDHKFQSSALLALCDGNFTVTQIFRNSKTCPFYDVCDGLARTVPCSPVIPHARLWPTAYINRPQWRHQLDGIMSVATYIYTASYQCRTLCRLGGHNLVEPHLCQ